MKKRVIRMILICVLTLMNGRIAFAGEVSNEKLMTGQFKMLDFSEITAVIDKSGGRAANEVDFPDLALKAVSGELDFTPQTVMNGFIDAFFWEVKDYFSLTRTLVIIAMLGAVFKTLSLSLKSKSVSELGFYVHYIIIVTLLLTSFAGCVTIMRDFAEDLCKFIEAAVPLMTSLTVLSGNPATAFVFHPVAMFGINSAEMIIKNVVAPVITLAAVLEIVNNISEREILGKLGKLIKRSINWLMGLTAAAFMGVLSLQRITAPIVGNAAAKTAKIAVNAVPVVGQVLTGAVDSALYWSGAVKSGVMVAVIIVIALMCAPVIIKLAAFTAAYKLTAGVMQPICDRRVADAIDAAGSLAGMALGACTLAAVMFIFLAMIIISV